MTLKIDRMELADIAQPIRLAETLLSQVDKSVGLSWPLQIEDIAYACGIKSIEHLETDGFEGGLIQDDSKQHGHILVKRTSPGPRRRFTIGHELGHFLNPWHSAPSEGKFLCTANDFSLRNLKNSSQHQRQEQEANEFSVNCLMPATQFKKQSRSHGSPHLESIVKIADHFGTSNEATARRFVNLQDEICAVVFSKDGVVRYTDKQPGFPFLSVEPNRPLNSKTKSKLFAGEVGAISEQEEVDSLLWLSSATADNWVLWEEVLIQKNGYRLTLLVGESREEENQEDKDLENSYTPKWRK